MTKLLFKRTSFFLVTLLLFIPQNSWADNTTKEPPKTPQGLPTMPQVLVQATRIAPTTGIKIIDKETIEDLPIRNGSVNEILSIVPGIQYSEDSFNSFTGGEITPPVVSVSGSRFYENNYTIDGISNNNPLDPASDTYSDANKLPGHPQIQFLSPQIIEQITVYNSNIPAEFGGFTGGQIDTETINPTSELWGRISYRTTKDSWTEFHIHPDNEDEFTHSDNSSFQPKFDKHDFGLIINTPLNKDTGLVASYQQVFSKIPLQHLDGSSDQSRKRENLFLKLEHFTAQNSRIALTALYSPTSADYFLQDVKDSDYTLETETYSVALQLEEEWSPGRFNLTLGYNNHRSERLSATNRYYWSPDTTSIDWSSGREGGLGALEMDREALDFKSDFSVHTFTWGQTDHQVKLGMGATYSKQHYRRPATSYYYYSPVVDNSTFCDTDDPACIENEQYLSRRTAYNKADSSAEVIDYTAYIQDSVAWKRLEIFPGVRVSYDDLTDNLNIAPRFTTSLDLFGDKKTILFAGKNRYYSGTLVTQSLYQSIVTENQSRTSSGNAATDWNSTISYLYQDGDVETPYTDEITLGVIQRLFAGELKAQYIEKTSKDEFARSRINNPAPEPDVYILNNFGRSEHKSCQLSWQRSWKKHFFEINGTWQETTNTHKDYDKTFDAEATTETVWYKGEELYLYEIPRLDFNRPVVANLIYIGKLPYAITFTNVTKYRGAYERLWTSGERLPSVVNPEQPDPFVYEKRKSHSSVIFDWSFSWEVPKFSRYDVALSLDIFNVFNKRAKIGYQTGNFGYEYELGRQIWAGLEFTF